MIEGRFKEPVMDDRPIEILRDLVAQQVEEIDWQFKENERLRDVLSKLPDEDEIEALVLKSFFSVRKGTQTLAENIAQTIAKRIGVGR